jgi:serpin B
LSGERAPGEGSASPASPTDPTPRHAEATDAEIEALVGARLGAAQAFFDQVRTPEGNVVTSPISLQAALQMTALGAVGSTAAEIRQAIGWPDGMEASRVEAASSALARRLQASEAVTVRIANRIWPDASLAHGLGADFLVDVERWYGATPSPLAFGTDAEAARQTINAWVSEQTADRIPELLAPGSVDAGTAMVLTNAVYFLADWARAFDPARTRDGSFTRVNGSVVPVPMMHAGEAVGYASSEDWQAVGLPYGDAAWSMVLVLPREGHFEGLAPRAVTVLDEAARALVPRDVQLELPRFTFRWRQSLVPALRALGVQLAFGGGDFSRMVPGGGGGIFLSEVVQEAFLQVDERGTEAAAATAVVATRSAPSRPVPIRVAFDRPFYLGLRHRPSGALLFVGQVTDPSAGG